jgi:hypothetical protein
MAQWLSTLVVIFKMPDNLNHRKCPISTCTYTVLTKSARHLDDTRATNASWSACQMQLWRATVTQMLCECCANVTRMPRECYANVVRNSCASYARHSSSKCDVKRAGCCTRREKRAYSTCACKPTLARVIKKDVRIRCYEFWSVRVYDDWMYCTLFLK